MRGLFVRNFIIENNFCRFSGDAVTANLLIKRMRYFLTWEFYWINTLELPLRPRHHFVETKIGIQVQKRVGHCHHCFERPQRPRIDKTQHRPLP